MNDDTLERLLKTSAAAVTYPVTPELASRVAARLSTTTPRRAPSPRLSPGYVLAAVVLLLVVALALNPSRDAIARFFGVEGLRIEQLPTPVPGVTPAPTTQQSQADALLTPIALSEVLRLSADEPMLPDTSEPLQGVYYVNCCRPGAIVYRYEHFDLWQTTLQQQSGFLKGVPGSAVLEEVSVSARPGVWIAGDTHVVYILDPAGGPIPGATWVVNRNTLVWRGESLFYRIETDLSLEEALRIAETLP